MVFVMIPLGIKVISGLYDDLIVARVDGKLIAFDIAPQPHIR
jgi:hypothetical protein